MRDIAGMLSVAAVVVLMILALIFVIAYSVRLQRRAVVTQAAVVDDHFAEKTQRQRQHVLWEEAVEIQRRSMAQGQESLEMQKRAMADDEETRRLLRRCVELNEEILKVLRASRG
jgi:uncharacterized membrane protein YhiD involved in acid resistance